MRNISLLPAEHKSYKRSEKSISRFAVIAVVLILVFVLLYATLSLALLKPQADLKAVMQQREQAQLKAAGLQSYEDKKAEISNVADLYRLCMENSPDWSSLLVQIFNSIPQNLWLSNFDINYVENKGVLNMRGWADSHSKVSDWLATLNANENLKNVLCLSSSTSGTDGSHTVQFEISAELVGVEALNVKAVEGGAE